MQKMLLTFVVLGITNVIVLGQPKPQTHNYVFKVDSAKYPKWKEVLLRPKWVHKVNLDHSIEEWAFYYSDYIIFADRSLKIIQTKSGEIQPLTSLGLKNKEDEKLILFIGDSILLAKEFGFEFVGPNAGRTKLPLFIKDSVIIQPNGEEIVARALASKRIRWKARQENVYHDKIVGGGDNVIVSRSYYDYKTDSISHSIIKIAKVDGRQSRPINIPERAENLESSNNDVFVYTTSHVIAIDISQWRVKWITKINSNQQFIVINRDHLSPNLRLNTSTGSMMQISTDAWMPGKHFKWKDFSILSFDDGENTRQFLVNSSRSKVYRIQYLIEDFAPCRSEAFYYADVLHFLNSGSDYIVAACQCSNGTFIYGFEFPELVD